MRDRMSEMQSVRHKPPDSRRPEEQRSAAEEQRSAAEEQRSAAAEEQPPLATFDGEEAMQSFFKEVRAIRAEIALLRMSVKSLGKQNSRFLTSVRRMSSIKRDSNALGRDIKKRAELTYARLARLEERGAALEEERGPRAALVRMVRSQYVSLSAAFHHALSEYNDAEVEQRENCKSRIQRQAEIMGKELSWEQVEDLMEKGEWNAFSENLLTDGRTGARLMALTEIENRHKELVELEGRIREVRDLFFQMALLVEEQGFMLDNIQANVSATQDYVAKATGQIRMALEYKRDNPCRKLCCCWLPLLLRLQRPGRD